jgi:hypothetical protein
MGDAVSWPADADEVIKGDLAAAAAYLTPAGGAVVTGVAPIGIGEAPPNKNSLLVLNGLLAKFGLWQARRQGAGERLAAARTAARAGEGGQPPPG